MSIDGIDVHVKQSIGGGTQQEREIDEMLAPNTMIEDASDINKCTLIFQRDKPSVIDLPVRRHHSTN